MKKLMISLGLVLILTNNAFAGGWYLMSPPYGDPFVSSYSGQKLTPMATWKPFSDWKLEEAFDSAKECKNARLNEIRESKKEYDEDKESKLSKEENMSWTMLENARASQCIASDDSRLLK